MKKKTLYLLAVFGLILTTACGNPKLKNGEEVIAKIDGKEYTADELYKELKGQYGYNTVINWIDSVIADKEVETTDEIKQYVDDAINFYQQYANAYEMTLPQFASSSLGLNGINSEEDLRNYILRDRKLTLAIEKQVASKIKDSEAQEFYNENYKTVYTYRDIIITNDEDAKDTIKKVKNELKDTKSKDLVDKFNELAKKYSADAENVLKENATKNTVDSKVWSALKDLDDNDYSKEIEASDGYHIVLRISKDKGKDFKDVKEEIKTTIAQQKLQEEQFLNYDVLIELRNKYKIVLFDSDLKDGYKDFEKQLADAKKQASNSNSNSDSNSTSNK